MRVIGRLISMVIGLFAVTAAVGAVAARAAKERIVRRDDPNADEVALAAIFEPLAFRSTARSFRGGTVDCWYGGGIIDLRNAALDPAGATLNVRAIFGGGQIVVPEDWQVEAQVIGFGGVGDSRPAVARPPGASRLTIKGFVLFGGFGISSTVPEDAQKWVEGARKVGEQAAGGTEPTPAPVGAPSE